LLGIGSAITQYRQHGCQRKERQSLAPAEVALIGREDAFAQYQQQGAGSDGHAGQQPANGIGLADIAHHFVCVNQIIDRDEVEAGGKLLPKSGFSQSNKDHACQQQPHPQQTSAPMDCAVTQPVRQQCFVNQYQRQHKTQAGEVEVQAVQENARPQRRRNLAGGPEQQADAGKHCSAKCQQRAQGGNG